MSARGMAPAPGSSIIQLFMTHCQWQGSRHHKGKTSPPQEWQSPGHKSERGDLVTVRIMCLLKVW